MLVVINSFLCIAKQIPMLKRLFIAILILTPLLVYGQENEGAPKAKPVVYLVGVVHSMHFEPDKHYSIVDLQQQVVALKPDLVCGEITPEAFEQPMEGFYPPEAAFLAEMANELGYRFVPVDWRLDNSTQAKANSQYPADVREKREALLNGVWERLATSSTPSIYDFIHDDRTMQSLDTLYETIIGPSALAEIATGSWNERNRRIVENALAEVKDAKIVVFVFGVDHLPQLKRYLKASGIEAIIPQRLFVPNNDHKMPEVVRDRWKLNMENLILIRDKKLPTSYDNYLKVISSRRIQDLEQAIEKSL